MMKKKFGLFLLILSFVVFKLDAIVKISQDGFVFVEGFQANVNVYGLKEKVISGKKFVFDWFIKAIAMSSDGSIIVVSGGTGIFCVLKFENNEFVKIEEFPLVEGCNSAIKHLVMSADGTIFAMGNQAGDVKIFRLDSEGSQIEEIGRYKFEGNGCAVRSITMTLDGSSGFVQSYKNVVFAFHPKEDKEFFSPFLLTP